MPKLPCVKPKQLIKVLKKIGFFVDRISGSHYILYKDEFFRRSLCRFTTRI